VRRDRDLRCARTIRAQRARDMDRDGRCWAHTVKLIIGGWDDATKAVPDWGVPWRARE
jgi:hypothetical protein